MQLPKATTLNLVSTQSASITQCIASGQKNLFQLVLERCDLCLLVILSRNIREMSDG